MYNNLTRVEQPTNQNDCHNQYDNHNNCNKEYPVLKGKKNNNDKIYK